jgi:hypothetical protein
MCSLSPYCYSPSPSIHCKTAAEHLVPFTKFLDDKANPFAEFGKWCYPLSEEKSFFKKKKVQELATDLTSTDFTIWHLVPAPCCQLYKPNMDIPVVYYPH